MTDTITHEIYTLSLHDALPIFKEGSGVAANVLKNLDVDLRKIRLEVEKLVQSGPDMVTMGKLPQTPRAKKVDRKSTRLNSSHLVISYAVFCLKKKRRRNLPRKQ